MTDKQKQIINKLYEMAKEREIHPSGKFDSKKRWEPSSSLEKHMENVRIPSRAWPFSYMLHCRTKKFIKKMVLNEKLTNLDKAISFYTNSN